MLIYAVHFDEEMKPGTDATRLLDVVGHWPVKQNTNTFITAQLTSWIIVWVKKTHENPSKHSCNENNKEDKTSQNVLAVHSHPTQNIDNRLEYYRRGHYDKEHESPW